MMNTCSLLIRDDKIDKKKSTELTPKQQKCHSTTPGNLQS